MHDQTMQGWQSNTQVFRYSIHTFVIVFLMTAITGCGLFGDDDHLDGNLTVEVEAPAGTSIQFTTETWDGESYDGSSETVSIPDSEMLEEDIENGNYEGVRAQVSYGFRGEPDYLVLRLLSDGEVIDETSTPEEDGDFEGMYIVEEGDFPDWEDFE